MNVHSLLTECIGGYGIVMVLGAYALNSFGILTARDMRYQLMNFTGGIAFVYYTYMKTAWASLFVNVVWVLIAVIGLWTIFRCAQSQNKENPAQ